MAKGQPSACLIRPGLSQRLDAARVQPKEPHVAIDERPTAHAARGEPKNRGALASSSVDESPAMTRPEIIGIGGG